VASATGHTSLQTVHEILAKRFFGKNIRIYEAGGGSATFIQSNIRNDAEVTVLDIDKIQLQNNSYADKKILGDVQTYSFPPNSFDLIVCYNVIEHLDAPDQAIRLFFQALVPGGLLFIGAPNPNSFSGWVTRLTPHWFHVWYYRVILRRKSAGQPGNGPFRTVYHPVVSPKALINYCHRLGFQVVYFKEYQGDLLRQLTERRPLVGRILDMAIGVANALTLWQNELKNGDFHIVLEKSIIANDSARTGLTQKLAVDPAH
jgi:ubiquinone/menaquinone biosynthesis C-methylase UbiE